MNISDDRCKAGLSNDGGVEAVTMECICEVVAVAAGATLDWVWLEAVAVFPIPAELIQSTWVLTFAPCCPATSEGAVQLVAPLIFDQQKPLELVCRGGSLTMAQLFTSATGSIISKYAIHSIARIATYPCPPSNCYALRLYISLDGSRLLCTMVLVQLHRTDENIDAGRIVTIKKY